MFSGKDDVIWLRDVPSGQTWSLLRCKVTRVRDIRRSCRGSRIYADFPDRGAGFPELRYDGKELNDDSVQIAEIRYPPCSANSFILFRNYVDVTPVPSKKYVVLCFDQDISLPLHIGTTVERLNILLRDRFAAPFDRLQVMLGYAELNNEDLLASVPHADGCCMLHVRLPSGRPTHVIFPLMGTVLDHISFLQVQLFRAKSAGKLFQLSIHCDGRPLRHEEVLSSLFPGEVGAIEVTRGPQGNPESAEFSFSFDSGMPYHLVLPSCSPLSFVVACICQLGHVFFK
jgi:hypothetical protein